VASTQLPSPARSLGASSPPSLEDPNPPVGIVLASGLALTVGGYLVRSMGLEDDVARENVKSELAGIRDKAARDELVQKQDALDARAGWEMSAGWMAMAVGGTLLFAGLASLAGAKFRSALLVGVLPLLAASYFGVFHVGPEALVPVTVIGVGVCLYLAWGSDRRGRQEALRFAQFPARVGTNAPDGTYRMAPVKKRPPGLTTVELPPWSGRALEGVGGGKVFTSYLLKKDLAYVAFVEADLTDVSDYVTVVLKLAERLPTFTVRPLPIDDGVRVPNKGIVFREDPEFSGEFLAEAMPGTKPADVRAFLAQEVRDELLGLPDVWMRVEGTTMTLTRFGRFDSKRTDELVEMADALFAEHGAAGGPSLLEPDGVEPRKTKAKKKKKPATPTEPSDDSSLSPA
jgi:hypothetical protein